MVNDSAKFDTVNLPRKPSRFFSDPVTARRVRLYRELEVAWYSFDYMLVVSKQQPSRQSLETALQIYDELGECAPRMPEMVAECVTNLKNSPRKRGRPNGIPLTTFLGYWRAVRSLQWRKTNPAAKATYETTLKEATKEHGVGEKATELWLRRIPLPDPLHGEE